MKGIIQQNLVFQRALRQDQITNQINSFENCNYYEIGKESNIQKFRIQIQESISLQQLIELYSCHYISLYKGQLLMILIEILNHLNSLHQQKLSHGQLQPKNILIRLGNQTGFSITYQKIQIKQIHFIRYKYFEDLNYQMNIYEDIKQICLTMIKFIDIMLKRFETCETLKFLKQAFSIDNYNQKDANYFLNQLQNLQAEYLNGDEQKLKINEIDDNKGSFLQRLIKPIRERYEPFVIEYLDQLNKQNLNTEICIQQIRNKKKKLQDQELLELQSKKYNMPENLDLISMEIVQNSLKMSVLKKICADIGRCFQENQQIILEELFIQFEDKANNQLQNCYDYVVPQIINGPEKFDSIFKELQENVEKYFKFKIAAPIDEAKEIYSKEWQLALQDQDIFNFNFEEFFNIVKENVKSQLQEYYQLTVYLEIIQLINELI